ncbi:MAG: phosphoadenosine phosphosulfate reductase family protein [Proteobacteria bacterium]|nr:phosphoadenosine phosphosulfate reductase family protein [Pseudomonadota bacterium]
MTPSAITDLISRGAVFVVNHSGGKDSQAMFIHLLGIVPKEQLLVVHAVLPEVEWDGIEEHIEATTMGVPVLKCRARRTLLQMIAERGMFPSPSQRQCTSDLKRGPIERTIRRFVEDRVADFIGVPRGSNTRDMGGRQSALAAGCGLIVNCMGMRAQESSSRSKLTPFKLNAGNSKAGREWYDWLPIHDWDVNTVFATIAGFGQKPHWAYAAGMSRLSCCFCIMSNKADLTTAARLNPELYRKYVELERSTGQVMLMPDKKHGRRTLEQVTGVLA